MGRYIHKFRDGICIGSKSNDRLIQAPNVLSSIPYPVLRKHISHLRIELDFVLAGINLLLTLLGKKTQENSGFQRQQHYSPCRLLRVKPGFEKQTFRFYFIILLYFLFLGVYISRSCFSSIVFRSLSSRFSLSLDFLLNLNPLYTVLITTAIGSGSATRNNVDAGASFVKYRFTNAYNASPVPSMVIVEM